MTLVGRRVLVTGGTGSFGNFLVRRLLDDGAAEVRVLSRDEKKQHDMRVHYGPRPDLTMITGDVRDRMTVDEAMHGIEVVFQAAALKQVPSCERFPMEALRTNVIGAENIVEAALRHRVEAVVAISTDKAVKPVNAMGMTKALQEKLVLRANESHVNAGTRLACVRYGNVLRSRGSIVPLFRHQLARGHRLTITDEAMTRFLLTLEEAIELVLYSTKHAQGGEVFVRKAPAARVADIAAVLSEEAGLPLDYDRIGVLPGEKIHEILISEDEVRRAQDLGEHFVIQPWWRDVEPTAGIVEYSSADHLVGRDVIQAMISRADDEFERLETPGGEYAKF